MRTREAPIFRLHPLEPFDGSSIPSLPRLKITLETVPVPYSKDYRTGVRCRDGQFDV